MLWRGKVCGLALGVVIAALPALAQQAEPSVLPANPAPVPASSDARPVGVPVVADFHVASTALGFENGIAPAPGRTIGYQGQEYLVVEVAAVGNGPTFSGGSRFVITVQGGALEVGLKAMDGRAAQVAAARR